MAGREVIIKKIKKGGGHGHHGGAWKVAYADFVTAMMAFFLLLWLLNATTAEQREGISNYFAPSAVSSSTSGSGGLLAGMSIAEMSALTSPGAPPLSPQESTEGEETDAEPAPEHTPEKPQQGELSETAKEQRAIERAQQDKQFSQVQEALKQEIQKTPELASVMKNLMMEITPEGLRIQLVDRDKQSMFPSGKAIPEEHMATLLSKVAKVIQSVPNDIAIAGHTDANKFPAGSTYTNWELSADRAQATRRMLETQGITPGRIVYVSGRADRDPLIKADPKAPANRRISITLMYKDITKSLRTPEKASTPIQDGVF